MAKKLEILAAIGRVRRAMPRNLDVMLVCDDLADRLTLLSEAPTVVPTVVPTGDVGATPVATTREDVGTTRGCLVCAARRALLAAKQRRRRERRRV